MINPWQKYVDLWSSLKTEQLRHDYIKINRGFVLNEDKSNELALHFNLNFVPQPYIGSSNASYYMLMTNPSWHEFDITHMGIEKINNEDEATTFKRFKICLNQLTFSNTENQFHLLHNAFSNLSSGSMRIKNAYDWWKQRIFCKNSVIKDENELFVLQLFPYRSYSSIGIEQFSKKYALKSSKYRNELLRNAIINNKTIYIMRSAKLWISAVPELKEYGIKTNNIFVAKNFQNATLSKSNLRTFKEYINEK